jgi:Fe-S-cluster containining protein
MIQPRAAYPDRGGHLETLGGGRVRSRAEYDGLFALYRDLDAACAALRSASVIACLPGCGACCETPAREIEATVAEMLPLAEDLCARGMAEGFLDRAVEAGEDAVCILYERNPGVRPTAGACTAYALRPLVCRLFGSAGVRDKHGGVRFSPCQHLKRSDPARAVALLAAIGPVLDVPVFADWRMRLAAIDPAYLGPRYPINLALALALDRTLRAYEAE